MSDTYTPSSRRDKHELALMAGYEDSRISVMQKNGDLPNSCSTPRPDTLSAPRLSSQSALRYMRANALCAALFNSVARFLAFCRFREANFWSDPSRSHPP